MSERSKDVLISTKSTKVSKDSKGRDRYEYSFDQATVQTLYETLGTMLGNERGVKLDFHTGEKETNDGTRTFLSSFAFVKPIQEFGANAPAGRTFAPKAKAASPTAQAIVKNATLGAK